MKQFTVIDKNSGEVLRTGCCPPGDFDKQAIDDNEVVREFQEGDDIVEEPDPPTIVVGKELKKALISPNVREDIKMKKICRDQLLDDIVRWISWR